MDHELSEKDVELGCKALLVAVSLGLGVAVFVAARSDGWDIVLAIFAALVVAFAYPVLAAVSVAASDAMLLWAFPGRSRWPVFAQALAGAVWPATILVCGVISVFFAMVNRLFR